MEMTHNAKQDVRAALCYRVKERWKRTGETNTEKEKEKDLWCSSHYLTHLLDKTAVPPLAEREAEDGGMKGRTVA